MRETVEQTHLLPSPGGSVASGSRRDEAGSVTNPPTEWDEGQGRKGKRAIALLIPEVARETEPRSPGEVFWWKSHALDSGYARDKSDNQRSERHRAHVPSRPVRAVALVDTALLLADNGVCRRVGGKSPLPQNFLFEPHGPSVEVRKRTQSPKGSQAAGPQFEGGENSVRRIEVGCHCWLSSWRRFHTHCERICHTSWPCGV